MLEDRWAQAAKYLVETSKLLPGDSEAAGQLYNATHYLNLMTLNVKRSLPGLSLPFIQLSSKEEASS